MCLDPYGKLTLEEVAKEYRKVCDEFCSGDMSVGIPSCPFYIDGDVDTDMRYIPPLGCRLELYINKKENNRKEDDN